VPMMKVAQLDRTLMTVFIGLLARANRRS
jgi:hypothetical protein